MCRFPYGLKLPIFIHVPIPHPRQRKLPQGLKSAFSAKARKRAKSLINSLSSKYIAFLLFCTVKKKVIVGLSGGVDSSVAAWVLKEQGYDVEGLFMRNWHDTTGLIQSDCHWEDDLMFAEMVAKKLCIPFHFTDLSEPYRKRVIDYMFAEYEKGRTPNPDILCNREIKFDSFAEEARKLGGDFVATGHYCRKAELKSKGKKIFRLLAGKDENKDQSYFLCQVSQDQLAYALFPIGGTTKPEVRKIASKLGLATAQRKDSQGICFVGKVHLPTFLQQKLEAKKGSIIEIPASAEFNTRDLVFLTMKYQMMN